MGELKRTADLTTQTALYDADARRALKGLCLARTLEGLSAMTHRGLFQRLGHALYEERQRSAEDLPQAVSSAQLIRLAAALHAQDHRATLAAAESMIRSDLDQIHNDFSPRTYALASRFLPGFLGRLLRGFHPARIFDSRLVASERIKISGQIEQIRRLTQRGSVILAPTHLSNLDSLVIGFALYECGLPPFVYGAGLNLFTQPVMSFFMSRLGAYIVDRTRKSGLYKDALKAYSTEALATGHHSLFFPGGTRSRSGAIERHVKKGLLGTGLPAWIAKMERGHPRPEVFVVPCSLSMSLVLEAETLISDSLQREGRGQYIIVDDEFSQSRTIFGFAKRMMAFDDPVHVVFGEPLDLMGNPVDAEGRSLDPQGRPIDRRAYVTDRAGQIVSDPQRDRIYTERLADKLVSAWHRDTIPLPTQIAAFAAWAVIAQRFPALDAFRLVRLDEPYRRLTRFQLLQSIERTLEGLSRAATAGRVRPATHTDPDEVAKIALRHFSRFHSVPALASRLDEIDVSMELTLYYRNRLIGFNLDERAIGEAV